MNIFKRIIFLVCLLASANAIAVPKTPKANGNWNSAATWNGGLPAPGDDIEIVSPYTVTMNVAETCNSLTIDNGGELIISGALTLTSTTYATNNGTLDFAANGTLKVGTYFTNSSVFTQGTGTVNFDGTANGTLTPGGATFYNLTIDNTGVGTNTVTLAGPITVANILTLTAGVLDVSSSNYQITMLGTGAAPAFTNNDATVGAFNAESGEVDFQGTANTINGSKVTSFYDLQSDVTSTLTSTTDAETIADNLTVNSGTLALLTRTMTVTNTVTIGSSATVTFSSGSIVTTNTTNGNFICNGVYGTSAVITTGGLTVAANTTIGAMGTILIKTGTFTEKGNLTNNGDLDFTGAAALNIAGNFAQDGTFPANTATVKFNGTANQSISGTGASTVVFDNLTIDNTGVSPNNVVSLSNPIQVSGTLSIIASSGYFSAGSNNIEVDGTFTNANTTAGVSSFQAGTGTVTFGSGATTLSGAQATTFNNLTINSGASTVTVTATAAAPSEIIGGNLLISSGTFAPAAKTIDVKGNFTNNAAFTFGTSTVIFNGAADQTINSSSPLEFYNLTISNSGAAGSNEVYLATAPASAFTIDDNLSITNGALECEDVSISGTGSVAGGKVSMTGGMLVLGLQSNAVNTPPSFPTGFAAAASLTGGTVIYQDGNTATPQTISITPTYASLCLYSGAAGNTFAFSGAGTLTVAGNLDIGDSLTSGVILNAAANTISLTGSAATYTALINGDGEISYSGAGILNVACNLINNSALAGSTPGFIAGTSNAVFKGTKNQSVGGTNAYTFNNFQIDNTGAALNNTVTLGNNISVLGNVTLTAGILDVNSVGNYEITCNGNWANNINSTTALNAEHGIVNFTNPGSILMSGAGQTNFYNLYINTAATFSVTVTGTHAAPAEVVGNDLDVNTGAFAMTGVETAVTDNVNIASGATVSFSNSANSKLVVTKDITNNGIVSFAGAGTLSGRYFYNNSGATYTGVSSSLTLTQSLYNNSAIAMAFSTGIITESGAADSVYNNAGASITFTGAGKLQATGDIDNSGTIAFPVAGVGILTAANFYNNSGATFTVNASTATISKNLYNNAGATAISLSTGSLVQTNAADSLYNSSGSSITYSGAGILNVTGNIGNHGSITFPAAAAGTLKFTNLNVYSGSTISGFTYAITASGNVIINGTLTFTGAGTLKVAGNFTNNATFNQGTSVVTMDGTTTSQSINGSVATSFYGLTINNTNAGGNTVTLADPITIVTAGTLTLTAGVLDVGAGNNEITIAGTGKFTNNLGTTALNAENGIVDFTGAGTLNGTAVAGTTFYNLNCDAGVGNTVTATTDPQTITNNLNVNSGTLNFGTTTITVGGTATIVAASTLRYTGAGTLKVAGDFSNSGTFTQSTSTVNMNSATANQNIKGSTTTTFYNLTINNTAASSASNTVFLQTAMNVAAAGTVLVQSGQFNCQTKSITPNATSHLQVNNGTTILFGLESDNAVASNFPAFTNADITLQPSSTVVYQESLGGAAGQKIALNVGASGYGNLNIYAGASGAIVSKQASAAGTITIQGNLTVGDGNATNGVEFNVASQNNTVTLNANQGNVAINADGNITMGSNPLSLTGNFTNNSALAATGFAAGTSTVTFNGSHANEIINGTNASTGKGVTTTFKNVVINNTFSSGTVSLGDSTIVGGTFTINSGGGTFDVSASNYSLVVNGGFLNNNATGSFNAERGTVYFDGTENIGGASSVSSSFYNIACAAGAGTVTMFPGLNETATANFISYTGTFAIGANTLTIDSNVTLKPGGAAIAMSLGASGALNVGGNFLDSNSTGAFSAANPSTTTFNAGASQQTIGGSFSATFNNIVIASYYAIITANENATGTFVINSGKNFDCGSTLGLTMAVTGTFTNNGIFNGDNGTLALSGDMTNNTSTFNAQTGTVSFNKSGSQNVNGSNAVSFYNATLNGSAAVNVSTLVESLQNILTLNATSSLSGSDSLTMLSTPSLTARIAPVASGASITLPFTMQRYISGTTAAYAALAYPGQSTTPINDWAYDPGFYMSGVGGPDGNSGSFKSVYTINEPTDAYVAVTSLTAPIASGQGLYIYMANTLSSFSPFTFSSHGLPKYGPVTIGVTHSASPGTGSNLVANPYDCPISWKALMSTTVPIGANSSTLGSDFSVYDRATGNWESSDGTTATCGACDLAAQPDVIPAHQGFLVLSNSASGTMTFAESVKTTTLDHLLYGPNKGTSIANTLRITLTEDLNTYSGNALIQFDSAAKTIYDGKEDVLYRKGLDDGAPVLYTLSSDAKFLSRNLLPMIDGNEQDIMFYGGGNVNGNYTLTFTGITNLIKYNCVQLEDLKTGKLVQLEEGTTYTYQVTNASTYKFILHFKKLQAGAACVLPVVANVGNENSNAAVDVFRSDIGAEARFTLTETQQAVITVYNMLGQQVGQEIVRDVMDEQVDVPLPSTNSMYIVRVQTPGGVTNKRIYH